MIKILEQTLDSFLKIIWIWHKSYKPKKKKNNLKIKKEKIDGVNYIKIKLCYMVETTINGEKTV